MAKKFFQDSDSHTKGQTASFRKQEVMVIACCLAKLKIEKET